MDTINPPDYETALLYLTHHLGQHGLQIVRSFDYQTTRETCRCDQCHCHTTPQCNCQLTVFLVYGLDRPPLTLMAHRHQAQSRFSVVSNPQQPADPELEAVITTVLAERGYLLTQSHT